MTSKKTSKQRQQDRSWSPDTEESTDEFLTRQIESGHALREAISFLIHRRELLRDAEIEWLEAQCRMLTDILTEKKNRILLEELECFREIISLQKRLAAENEEHGD